MRKTRKQRLYVALFAAILLFVFLHETFPLKGILRMNFLYKMWFFGHPVETGTAETPEPSWPASETPLLSNSSFPSTFLINPQTVCQRSSDANSSLFLLILVFTAVQNKDRRTAIRNTWGSVASVNDSIRLAFLVGSPANRSDQNDIDQEGADYNDIIQLDFIDSYQNLTLKSVMMLQWVTEICPDVRFVLKSDDDMYVNVANLVRTLNRSPVKSNVIYGFLLHLRKVKRSMLAKWFVPEDQFQGAIFPDFVSGTAYVLSGDVVPKLLHASSFVTFLWLEDAFVTGLCAEWSHVRRFHMKGFTNAKRPATGLAFREVITGHFVRPRDMYKIWAELQEKPC